MKAITVILIAICVVGCATADPFARLAKRLSTEELDGRFTRVELPESASPTEVAADSLRWEGASRVLRVGSVTVNGVISPAVLIETERRTKRIVVMHFVAQRGWWWTRAFDANKDA
jgi:hypothetical protein